MSITMTTGTGGVPETELDPLNRQPRSLANAKRCGAKTRAGKSCRCPAVSGRARCVRHGGRSPGGPKGEANGNWKNGAFTRAAVALRQDARALLKEIAEHA